VWGQGGFDAVLLPGETLIQLEPRRQGVEGSLVRCKLVRCCAARKNIIGVELLYLAPQSGKYNQGWAGLGCSISQKKYYFFIWSVMACTGKQK